MQDRVNRLAAYKRTPSKSRAQRQKERIDSRLILANSLIKFDLNTGHRAKMELVADQLNRRRQMQHQTMLCQIDLGGTLDS